jgi:hypothetical protein
VWRDGVHVSGTPIWCDARRRRDVCFASAADRVARGHGQLIATPDTLALVGTRGDGDLAVPTRRRFTLGTLRLELIPSGRGIGAAALHVDVAGKTVLYAGAVRTAAGSGEPAEVRACDALVVGAPFGEPHHAFPSIADVAAEVRAWATARLADRPVLVVDSVVDALEVVVWLPELAFAAGKPVRDAVDRVARPDDASRATTDVLVRIGTVAIPALAAPSARHARVTIRIAGERASDAGPRALVSGRAIDGHAGFAAGFAWASAAGHRDLLAWIAQTGARQVYVTGPCADAIARATGGHVLGPPTQMQLGIA